MGDLKLGEIPLEDITLVKMDVNNKMHMNAIKGMRDYTAREMCYDVLLDVEDEINKEDSGRNAFLVKNDDGYFGYMNISDSRQGERVLCYIIQEKLRGKGLGKILVSNVSDFLLNGNFATSIKLNINRRNVAGIGLATSCGFERGLSVGGTMCEYSRKK